MKHILIVVPGLGDNYRFYEWAMKDWENNYNITPFFYKVGWNTSRVEIKLKEFLHQIDSQTKQNRVSLMGLSAGGSFVINAFSLCRNKIYKVINNCGRLREGKNVFPSLTLAAKGYPAFKESVLLCEQNQKHISSKDRKKIMTIRPFFDEIVPSSTTDLEGAITIQIPSIQHMVSMGLSVTLFRKRIIDFLTQ